MKKSFLVVTVDGTVQPSDLCRLINGEYYLIGDRTIKNSGQCYLIESEGKKTYYKANNPDINWNHSVGGYQNIKKDNVRLVYGIVEIEGRTIKKEFFDSRDIIRTIEGDYIYKGVDVDKHVVWNSAEGYYQLSCFYNEANNQSLLRSPGKPNYSKFRNDVYSMDTHPGRKKCDEEYATKWGNTPIHPIDQMIFGHSIGVEVETSSGSYPEDDILSDGILPLKDGSISSHEYASVIIKDKFFDWMNVLFTKMARYTRTNEQCSLHYHIGTINYGKSLPKFTVALWELYCRLQEEIEDFIPPYKREISYLANKPKGPKDHCKRLPMLGIRNLKTDKDVQLAFEKILIFMNEGEIPKYDNENGVYIYRRANNPKWEQNSRYHTVNLLTFLFEKKHTIEFRVHSGTVNKYKALYWLMICLSIIKYAEDNIDTILFTKDKITLDDVIEYAVSKIDAEQSTTNRILLNLINYIKKRQDNMTMLRQINDCYGHEFRTDHTYSHTYQGVDIFSI